MGRKHGSIVCRIRLSDYEKDMLKEIGRVLRVHDDSAEYGNTLAAFFRVVIEYAERHPDSDFTLEIRRIVEGMEKQSKRPYRRRLLKVLEGIPRKVSVPRAWLDMSIDEAHDAALVMEASRILREARRERRSRRVPRNRSQVSR